MFSPIAGIFVSVSLFVSVVLEGMLDVLVLISVFADETSRL